MKVIMVFIFRIQDHQIFITSYLFTLRSLTSFIFAVVTVAFQQK